MFTNQTRIYLCLFMFNNQHDRKIFLISTSYFLSVFLNLCILISLENLKLNYFSYYYYFFLSLSLQFITEHRNRKNMFKRIIDHFNQITQKTKGEKSYEQWRFSNNRFYFPIIKIPNVHKCVRLKIPNVISQ